MHRRDLPPVPWDLPLSRRWSQHRLAGIDVCSDFSWSQVFGHNRSAFPNGQSLCEAVKRDCPSGKMPTLILTGIRDREPEIIESDHRYIVIVPIHHYLAESGADAASTYYARLHGKQVTRLSSLSDADFTKQELAAFLDEHLDREALKEWLAADPGRGKILEELVRPDLASLPPEVLAAGVRAATELDGELLSAITDLLGRTSGKDVLPKVLAGLTESSEGRSVATSALADRLTERIADTRRELDQYQELVASPSITETDVQAFLEDHPWILGLPYVRARGRVAIPRGTVDFVLDRYDGFFDIVELKGPEEQIITERQTSVPQEERPGPPSTLSLSPALSNALAQAHLYRSILLESQGLRAQFGLTDTRQPRILILIGRAHGLSDSAGEVLRQLNLSLHRVEVIPYDQLGQRTTGLLDNLEALLSSH